jgi:hypothetical protein
MARLQRVMFLREALAELPAMAHRSSIAISAGCGSRQENVASALGEACHK